VQCGDTHKTAPPRGDGAGFAWRLLASFRPGSLPGPGLLGEIRRASLPKLEQRAPRERARAEKLEAESWAELGPRPGSPPSGVVLIQRRWNSFSDPPRETEKKKWKGYASVGVCPAVLNRPGPRAEKDERRGYQ